MLTDIYTWKQISSNNQSARSTFDFFLFLLNLLLGQISRRTSKEDMETRTRAENRCKSAGIHREMSIHRQESGDVDENPPELRQQLNDAYSKQKR